MGNLVSFLDALNTAPVTTYKLGAILNDANNKCMLEIELAAVVDAGEPLVNATNVLEGNGELDFDCQKVLF